MRLLPVLLLAPLPGCHLFVSGEIEKTCDDIPGCADGLIDSADTETTTDDTGPTGGPGATDDTGDTGVTGTPGPGGDDTAITDDTGTAPVLERTRGVIVFGVSFTEKRFGLWIYDADNNLDHELFIDDAEPDETYILAYDDARQRFIVGFQEQVAMIDLPKKPGDDVNLAVGDAVTEIKVLGGAIWVIGEETIGVIEGGGAGAPAYTRVSQGVFTQLSGGYYADSRGTIEVVDLDRSSPDLWALDINTLALNRVAADFDDQEARSRLPFGGRDDDPWSCTSAGAVYSLTALQAGELEPERILSQATSDIFDCDYDEGSDEVVMFSSSGGALRVSASGEVDRFALPSDYTLLSGAVW